MAEILRAMTTDGAARAVIINSTDISAEAHRIHGTEMTASAALGRVLTAASMMGSLMPEKENLLTIRFKGDGAGGTILASADYAGNVRGFIQNPACELARNEKGKLDVGACVGKGQLHVMRDTGGAEPYIGISDIVSGEIAEDLAYYYAMSEQIPTVMILGVLVGQDRSILNSGGFLFQLLPFADESLIPLMEENIGKAQPITEMLKTMSIEEILAVYLNGTEYDIFDRIECRYECTCSREKTDSALISLGKEEIKSLLDSEEKTLITCQFCDKVYEYTKTQLEELLR